MLTLETRLTNLENLVRAQGKEIARLKFYQGADIAGVRQGVANVTPFIMSEIAYIDDTQIIFDNVPDGNVSVFMVDGEGQNVPFTFERVNGSVVVSFDKRNSLATVSISIS